MRNLKEKFIKFIKKETVLSVAFVLALLSMLMITPDKEYITYIDYKTLGLLFGLMIVMAGLQSLGIFQRMGEFLLTYVRNSRAMAAVLIFLCFFTSMFITNDVALLTFVPLTMIVLKLAELEEILVPVVVLQTIAANLGSMLLPFGNPQNLYLYGQSGFGILEFMEVILPYGILSFFLLLIHLIFIRKSPVSLGQEKEKKPYTFQEKIEIFILILLFLLCVLAVTHILPWIYVVAIVAVAIFFLNKSLFLKVDYSLLCTFICFFIFVGNLGRIPLFCNGLKEILEGNEVVTAVLASQVISNVPAALLLSGFTQKWEALIIGTNLGGLGTLIASMASLISYKQVAAAYPEKKGKYFRYFTVVNISYLLILMCA